MNELTIYNTEGLTNKKLTKAIEKINNLRLKDNKTKWDIADTIHNIVANELFVEDFENEGNLAEYLGMKRSYLNRLKRASEYHKLGAYEVVEDGKTKVEYPLSQMTVNQIIELLPIPADHLFDIMGEYDIKTTDTCASIREGVQAWKEDSKLLATTSTTSSSTSSECSTSNNDGDTEDCMNEPEQITASEIIFVAETMEIVEKLKSSQKSELINNILYILDEKQKETVSQLIQNDF